MSNAVLSGVAFPQHHRSRAQETPALATVHDIRSAPSYRRRLHTVQAEASQEEKRSAVASASVRPRSIVLGVLSTLALSVAAVFAGLAAQPSAYAGPTVERLVIGGDSVWSLAQSVTTDRPLEEVVMDIERLNDIDGVLHVGQRVRIPTR